jgi:hypothetical protein
VAEVAAAVRAAAAADLSSDSERARPNVVAPVSAQMLSGVEAWLRAAGIAARRFLLLSGLPRLPEGMVDR